MLNNITPEQQEGQIKAHKQKLSEFQVPQLIEISLNSVIKDNQSGEELSKYLKRIATMMQTMGLPIEVLIDAIIDNGALMQIAAAKYKMELDAIKSPKKESDTIVE